MNFTKFGRNENFNEMFVTFRYKMLKRGHKNRVLKIMDVQAGERSFARYNIGGFGFYEDS